MISIIIPLYNKESFIKKCLESIFQQTFLDFEVIIINDGSTDNSLSIIETFKDERINVYSITNNGVSNARNYGVKKAKKKLIAFLDADDWWESNYLEEMTLFINKYDKAVLFGSNFNKIYPDSCSVLGNLVCEEGYIEDYFSKINKSTIFWTSTCIVKKEVFELLGGFDTRIKYGEDLDLWFKLAEFGLVAYNNKVLANYYLPMKESILYVPKIEYHLISFLKYRKYFNNRLNQKYFNFFLFKNLIPYHLSGNYKKEVKSISSNLPFYFRLIFMINSVLLSNVYKYVKNKNN